MWWLEVYCWKVFLYRVYQPRQSVPSLTAPTSIERNQHFLCPDSPVMTNDVPSLPLFLLLHFYNFCSPLKVENESNTLQDGSLIDLCGATLLWRTPAGLRHTPTLKQLESLRQELNAARPQCPVGFNTLAFPSLAQREIVDKKQPWVYVNCGHVHGYHNWGYRKEKGPAGPGGTAPASTGERECPMCRRVGPYVPLWLGCEGGLYLDAGPPTHAFCPCGHVCSEKTVVGWSQIPLPHGTHAFHAACPFCGTWLTGEQGHIKLIFQGPVD